MNNALILVVVLLATAALSSPLVAAEQTQPGASGPIEVGPDVRDAWNALKEADSKIAELIARSRLADVAAQTRIVKESVGTILRGIRPPDESSLKRLVSVGREMIALADHLADVAASGNRGRADVVHANLHKYVDFVQKHLPPLGVAPGEGTPSS